MVYRHKEELLEVYLNVNERDKDIEKKISEGWTEVKSSYKSFDFKNNTEFISGSLYPYTLYEREKV